MTILIKILILLFVNALGFIAISLNITLGQISGAIDITNPQTNAFIATFFQNSTITWSICALISIGFLFLKGLVRIILLLAPLIIPTAYGLSALFLPALF